MGFNAEGSLPPRRSRKAKKKSGSSGKGSGTTVGLSIAIFGSAGLVVLLTIGYIVHGYLA